MLGEGSSTSATRSPAPHPEAGKPARRGARLALELGERHRALAGDQGGLARARASAARDEPVVESHAGLRALGSVRLYRCDPRMGFSWAAHGSYTDIRYETGADDAEGIAKITIARPEVRNAFRPETLIELSDAFERAREDTSIGVIVLTGEGPEAFCSGGDQRVRGDAGYVAGGASVGRFHVTDLHVQMRRLPKPVVAMVAGYAIGGGHVLHVVCDLTIAADNARFGQTGPQVGSFDGGFGAALLASQVGQKKAKEIWFLCRQYYAAGGARDGARQHGRPARASWRRRPSRWCREMLRLSPFALRLLKASFNAAEDGLAGLQQLAHDANLLFYMSEEAQEGRNAYREKRDARLLEVPPPALRRRHVAGVREAGPKPRPAAHLGDGRAAAHAAGGDRAGARRHGAGRQRGRVPPARVLRGAGRAASSSRSGRTSPTTTPTRAAAPTPRSGWGRCASRPAGSCRRARCWSRPGSRSRSRSPRART